MKTMFAMAAAMAVTCALAMPAAAQYANQGEINTFNAFLNHHPKLSEELSRNPNLVDSKVYLERHPELHSYLANHDSLRNSIQHHPGVFMRDRRGRYSYGWNHEGGPTAAWGQEWDRMHNYGYNDPADHQWHNREWWEHNRGDWVRDHHPNWEAADAAHRERAEEWQEHHGGNWQNQQGGDWGGRGHHDNGRHEGWYKNHGPRGHDND
ncbi:MAG: hypothetical protein IVW54_04595 [Candidatus Binataceae bacterium]|nr:hypothetical protein [Candidatus Binataceae bacterium]